MPRGVLGVGVRGEGDQDIGGFPAHRAKDNVSWFKWTLGRFVVVSSAKCTGKASGWG